MKVLHQDRKAGEIKVQVESLDDLWHLYNVIEPGDVIISVTFRRDESKSDKIRAERVEKKKMVLGVRSEKIDFSESDSRLRILGVIVEGAQDISAYHTLNIGEGDILTIRKQDWSMACLERIKRAVDDSKRPKLLFVSLENEEALIAVARQFGMQEIAHIYSPSSGKFYEQKDSSSDYYDDIIQKIKQIAEPDVPLIILGPGFAKEALLARGKEKEPELFKGSLIYHTGQAGIQGIHELMKEGLGAEAIQGSRVAIETHLVEKALEEIAKDGMVAYGPLEVQRAVDIGAVDTLLVLDVLVRQKKADRAMASVESARGKIVVISEHIEAGKKLDSIGGIVALLRFRLPMQ